MNLKDQLLEAGYKEYKPSSISSTYVTNCYQKCYADSNGKKYFINVDKYDGIPISKPNGFEYSFNMQTETFSGSIEIKTVQWFFSDNQYHPTQTLRDVEILFEKIWIACGSNYYD